MLQTNNLIGFGSGGASGPKDPYFSSVVFLLGNNGINAGTGFSDDSNTPHTITPVGTAQVDTAIAKFNASLLCSDGNYLSLPDHADWAYGAGDFTGECWAYFTAISSRQKVISQFVSVHVHNELHYNFTDSQGMAYNDEGATGINPTQGSNAGWVAATWYHLCFERAGNTCRVYRDGVILATSTASTNASDVAAIMAIGGSASTNWFGMGGNLEEVRITKGVARYNGAFTPPIEAFPRS